MKSEEGGHQTTWGKVRKVGGWIPPVFAGGRGEGVSPWKVWEGRGQVYQQSGTSS